MKTLKLYDHCPEVQYLKALLNSKINSKLDTTLTLYNTPTKEEVERYQNLVGLKADSIVGPLTWTALIAAPFTFNIVPLQYNLTSLPNRRKEVLDKLWDKHANTICSIADQIGIEPSLLFAVILVESAGTGFEDKKLLIRFEAHIFERILKSPEFDTFFRHDKDKPWLNQEMHVDGSWQPIHKNQVNNYTALGIALKLSPRAYESISMGLAQLMGFHYNILGFDSAEQMFQTQSLTEEEQLFSFATFLLINPSLLLNLIKKDLLEFARYYNGFGQAQLYAEFISNTQTQILIRKK